MRTLYHFPMSPFSRRTRLALAHKGLTAVLRDARGDSNTLAEARKYSPLKTVPVLVEADGLALGDSVAISHYLDRAYPDAPILWPIDAQDAHRAFEVASLVDEVLNNIVNTGNRFYSLNSAENWPEVKADMVDRIQRALGALEARVVGLSQPTIASSGWSAADIWLFTMITWLERLPARAVDFALARQLAGLGWTLPLALSLWADQHRDRPDIQDLELAL